MNSMKPLREGYWNSIVARFNWQREGGEILGVLGEGSRWTIESRSGAHRNRHRLREPGSCLCNPSGTHRILARWRLRHIASLIRAAASDERCAGIKETCTTALTQMEGFAGSLPVIEVRRTAPTYGVLFESRDIGDACRVSKVERPSATRSSHSARSPAKGAIAPVSQASQFAQSHEKPVCLLADLATVLSWRQVPDNPALTGRRVRSGCGCGSNWGGKHRDSHRAADQERKGSSGWVTMPTCSAFYAPVTSAPELSLRRTRRELGLLTLLKEFGAAQQPSASPLRALPNFTRGHRGGRRTLDEDRIGGFERQRAMLYNFC